ncbi:hypothetical protein OOT33_13715 [Sphingobium sp. DEHP117]|uniref:hypothetical protein n=1 Tax=Sphingobium sp. DEHP117 TaxID=2993436 RepID=UPI0027D62FA0|nr:hypothetical protein [Sphingobium sp. DEHP117]MDQ4421480.1 hypothetical protein [Sphingobium sp. DEHP117]
MLFFPSRKGGASQPGNPNHSYELDDLVADAIAVTSGGGSHALGNYVSLGDIDQACSGLILEVGGVGTATMRCQWSLRKNGSTVFMPDLHINPGTNSWNRINLPLALATNDTVEVALRCQAASQAMRAAMVPIRANSLAAPGFAAATGLSVSTGGTYPHAQPVGNGDGTSGHAWTELIASTAADYGAIMTSACNDSVPATAQRSVLCLATGAAGSEVEFYRTILNVITSSPYLASAVPPVIRKSIPAGSRLSARIIAPTPNADTFRVGLWGFA